MNRGRTTTAIADDILAARQMNPDYVAADAPVFAADPMNITLVVETGDHHVSVLDGDTFEVLDRFATPFAVLLVFVLVYSLLALLRFRRTLD